MYDLKSTNEEQEKIVGELKRLKESKHQHDLEVEEEKREKKEKKERENIETNRKLEYIKD